MARIIDTHWDTDVRSGISDIYSSLHSNSDEQVRQYMEQELRRLTREALRTDADGNLTDESRDRLTNAVYQRVALWALKGLITTTDEFDCLAGRGENWATFANNVDNYENPTIHSVIEMREHTEAAIRKKGKSAETGPSNATTTTVLQITAGLPNVQGLGQHLGSLNVSLKAALNHYSLLLQEIEASRRERDDLATQSHTLRLEVAVLRNTLRARDDELKTQTTILQRAVTDAESRLRQAQLSSVSAQSLLKELNARMDTMMAAGGRLAARLKATTTQLTGQDIQDARKFGLLLFPPAPSLSSYLPYPSDTPPALSAQFTAINDSSPPRVMAEPRNDVGLNLASTTTDVHD